MRTLLAAALFALGLAFASCSHGDSGAPGPAAGAEQDPVALDSEWEVFGAEIGDGEAVPVADLFDRAEELAGQRLLVTGRVDQVCKNKGCWMTLADGDRSMRVTFKDYGFFVPKDCEGREVVAEGVFDVKEISEEMRRHYLEDQGRTEEAAAVQGSAKEFSFVADGVRMKRGS